MTDEQAEAIIELNKVMKVSDLCAGDHVHYIETEDDCIGVIHEIKGLNIKIGYVGAIINLMHSRDITLSNSTITFIKRP